MNTTDLLVCEEGARIPALKGSEAHHLLTVGEEFGWPFIVLGRAPMPTQAVRIGEWLIVPAEMDSSPIPERALKRVRAIYAAGVRPKGFVLVHEAPLQLTPPKRKPLDFTDIVERIRPVLETTGKVAGVVAVATLAVAAMLALLALPLPLLVLGTIAVDPILVAVTEEGVWIEIDRWNR
jgi:hypothetical protein